MWILYSIFRSLTRERRRGSRAAAKRDRAHAALYREQARAVHDQRRQYDAAAHRDDIARREAAAGDNPWRQPTLGGAIRTWQRNRQD